MSEQTPWCYIAHKDGAWAGLIAGDSPKKDLRKFLGDFAADGFAIMPVSSREEYTEVLKTMKMWRPIKQHEATRDQ